MAGVVAILATLIVAVASLSVLLSARTQAATAADAAALAAAPATYPSAGYGSPAREAERVARLNGASLLACICAADATLEVRLAQVTTEVVVDVPIFGTRRVRATSRAEFDPRTWLGR